MKKNLFISNNGCDSIIKLILVSKTGKNKRQSKQKIVRRCKRKTKTIVKTKITKHKTKNLQNQKKKHNLGKVLGLNYN